MQRLIGGIGIVAALAGAVALAGWLIPWGDGFDLEAAVRYTCETVQTTPYDSVMTIRANGDTIVGESYFSGRDSRHISTRTNSRGEITSRGEAIKKDGVLYTRSSESDDNPTRWSPWASHGTGHYAYHFACFSLEDVATGAVTGDSGRAGERHIVNNVFLSEDEGTEKREFWADSTGKPLRGQRTFNIPAASGASGASGQAATTIVADIVYSGFGEPNTITAPVISSQ